MKQINYEIINEITLQLREIYSYIPQANIYVPLYKCDSFTHYWIFRPYMYHIWYASYYLVLDWT